MRLEPDYSNAVSDINNNPMAARLFNQMIGNKTFPSHYLITQRRLKMPTDKGIEDLIFYTEVLPESTRFSFIHFFSETINISCRT